MKNMYIVFILFSVSMLAQTNFEKGEKLFIQKKYNEAKPLLLAYLKGQPNHVKTLEYLGDIGALVNNWEDGEYYYKKLLDLYPKNADYWYKYGGSLGMIARSANRFKALGMIDDIEKAFNTAANLDKTHIGSRWALVMLYIELPGIIGGSEKKSQKFADELMVLSKVDGYLAKGYIDAYFKRYTKAEIHYKKAHEIGNSKTTFEKLYDLYLNKHKDKAKANKLKEQFEK